MQATWTGGVHRPAALVTGISVTAAFSAVSEDVAAAAREAHEALERAGIRHALVGGLAVGAWGHPRATRDVDYLVGPEAFVHHGRLVTVHPAVPVAVGTVAVDPVAVNAFAPFLEEALAGAIVDAGIPVVRLEHLIALKLMAFRPRDRKDILDLAETLDLRSVRTWLASRTPDLVARFDGLVVELDEP